MPEPLTFPTETSKFALPLLFAGQAQKEFFVNQSLAMIDALLGQDVVASQSSPPADPIEGEAFRVTDSASGGWEGHERQIAVRIGGGWRFVPPLDGMRVFDRGEDVSLVYRNDWITAYSPADPQGGSVVDLEARAAISELSQALRDIGLLKNNA